MKSISRTALIYLTLFIVLSMPFFLALIPQNFNNTEFSIYNQNWDGLSEFRSLINNNYPQVQIKTLIGSANVLNRLNQSIGTDAGTLIIMGPKIHYDPFEAIAILLYAIKGGRVVIADDFGTSNDILNYFSMLIDFLSNNVLNGNTNVFGLPTTSQTLSQSVCTPPKANPFPIVGIAINQSVLIDTQNYYKSPVQPVFTPPPTSTITGTTYTPIAPWLTDLVAGVSSVIGNYAATISMKVKYPVNFTDNNTGVTIDSNQYFALTSQQKCAYNPSTYNTVWVPFSEFPASITKNIAGKNIDLNVSLKLSALYSSQISFLDPNVTAAKDVNNIKPSSADWGNIEFPVAVEFPIPISGGSLTVISDPSIFVNRYLKTTRYPSCQSGVNLNLGSCEADPNFNPNNYDNRLFAENLITSLVGDRPNSTVYFDEGHLAQSLTSPTLYLGSFFRYLDFMSMVPLIAPFLPFLVWGFARKLAPKGTYGSALLKTKAENYYGRSYFAFKMRWFLENRHFTRGLELIYRRVKRDLINRYHLDEWSVEAATTQLYREYPSLRKNIQRKMFEIENILNQNILIEEQQFMDLYLALSEINNHIKL